jgi:hypothetical protein
MNINDHPLAKTLPKATESASIQTGPGAFRAFAARDDAPETLDYYINHDEPQLALHITSFNDATLVSLSWLHTLMDVMGQQALLLGWSLVLAGRESEVPPMLGAREDAICAATDAPIEKEAENFNLGQIRLKGWGMLMFGIRFAWDMMWNRVVETRTIFLPNRVVAELRRQAQSDLTAQDGGEKNSFVSEGDVLTAWAIRVVASAQPQPRPVTALHALNVRFRLPSLINAPGLYIQNMAVAAFAMLSPDVATGPLGQIALENRRFLTEQASEAQVLAGLRELRQDFKAGTESVLMCGEPHAVMVPFTNWTRANFFNTIKFSPALVCAGETGESRSNPPGTIVYHHAQSMRPSPTMRNVVVVLGKDHGENYWLTATLLPAAWAKMEEDIKIMG